MLSNQQDHKRLLGKYWEVLGDVWTSGNYNPHWKTRFLVPIECKKRQYILWSSYTALKEEHVG